MGHGFELVREEGGLREWTLPSNGLSVLVLETPVAPVATFCVVYGVGSRHEANGHTGATHILEHLMFKGTERYNRDRGNEAARVLEELGASFNATTWLDRTSYFATAAVEDLQTVIDIEADRMRGALIRDEDLASERTVVLNELERGENDPFDLLLTHSFAAAFLEHPYHHPTIGWRSDVENVSVDTLRGFYDTFYHPNNATVVLAGAVDEDRDLALIERRFGALPTGPPTPPVLSRERPQRGERRFVLRRSGEVGWVAGSWHVPEALHADQPALSVAGQVLADGVTSRLHQRLVETNRCLSVFAAPWQLHDPGLFQVFAMLSPGVGHDEVESVIRDEIGRLRREPPSEDETARARVQVETQLAFQRESPERIAGALTECVAVGDWRLFTRELDLVAAVTPGDVRAAVSRYLVDDNATVGWFVPEGGGGEAAPSFPRPAPCRFREPFADRVVRTPLPGGAEAAVVANPHAPTVTVAGSLLGGRASAPADNLTVPSFAAAMLDRGTAAHSRLELAAELEDHGLDIGVDSPAGVPTLVSFSAQGLAREWSRLSGLLLEVLRRPVFPEDELEKVRERAMSELIRERELTFPQAYAALTRSVLPVGHPHYRRPVEDREADVRSLTREQLARFHQQVYGPASLKLAVVGDVVPAEIIDHLSELLEGWSGGLASVPDVPRPTRDRADDVLIQIADRPNVDMLLGHAGRLRWSDPDRPAAILANACLGQSTLTSRLGREVRDRAGLTYGIVSRFLGTMHVPGLWGVSVSVAPKNVRRAERLCREIIADYVGAGPTEEELSMERRAHAGAYRVGLSTNGAVARELATVLAAGAPVSHLDTYPERLLATTADDVRAALERHLDPERLVMTAAGSLEGAAD